MTITRPTRLRLATETLRFLALATADASRDRPCHSKRCSDGPPCDGSRETCP